MDHYSIIYYGLLKHKVTYIFIQYKLRFSCKKFVRICSNEHSRVEPYKLSSNEVGVYKYNDECSSGCARACRGFARNRSFLDSKRSISFWPGGRLHVKP